MASPSPLPQVEPVPISAPEAIVAHALQGTGRRLVVVCVGQGSPHADIPAPEFVDQASANGTAHVLFLADPARSWMNGDGVAEAMVQVVADYRAAHEIDEVVTLGDSMGGFAALVLPDLMPVNVAVAFAPQFSIDRALVPEETRWRGYAERIGAWRYRDVGALAAEGTSYAILHGSHPAEAAHWMRFPALQRGSGHFIMAGHAHNVAALLMKRRIIGGYLEQAMAGKSRAARVALEKSFLDRRFIVRRREDYVQEHPELQLAEGGAPVVRLEADT